MTGLAALFSKLRFCGWDLTLGFHGDLVPPDCQEDLSMQSQRVPSGASFYFLVPLLSLNMSLQIKFVQHLISINLFLVFILFHDVRFD
jgi:hypothetical protein